MPTPATADTEAGTTQMTGAVSPLYQPRGGVNSSVTRGGSLTERGYETAPFSRFQHQAVDWLGLMHRRHTAYLLTEADVTEALETIRRRRGGSAEQQALIAFVTACLAQAIDEDRQMHAYRKGRTQLTIFDDVDVAMLLNYDGQDPDRPAPPRKLAHRTPHVIRAANKKSPAYIEREIQTAKTQRTSVTVWLPFWLLLPAAARKAAWMGLLNNPGLRKRLTGTAAVSAMGMSESGTSGRWEIPLTAYTISVELGGIARKPGIVPVTPETTEPVKRRNVNDTVEPRDYLSITVSFDDDIINGAQAARFTERLRELIEAGTGLTALAPETSEQPEHSGPGVSDDATAAINAIKGIHTAIFAGLGTCVGYIVYSGFTGRVSRITKAAAVTLTSEALIFSRNGFRCPLADMAEDLGSESGTVGDMFLPRWFSDRIPVISSALLFMAGAAYAVRKALGLAAQPDPDPKQSQRR